MIGSLPKPKKINFSKESNTIVAVASIESVDYLVILLQEEGAEHLIQQTLNLIVDMVDKNTQQQAHLRGQVNQLTEQFKDLKRRFREK